jgi:hypothetical protein
LRQTQTKHNVVAWQEAPKQVIEALVNIAQKEAECRIANVQPVRRLQVQRMLLNTVD